MSKSLKIALKHIMRAMKDISLKKDSPFVDSNMIFLFLEELRAYMKNLRAQNNVEKKKSKIKKIAFKIKNFKVLVKYLDKDFDEIKKSLYSLFESKKITFDLFLTLFKSDEIIYISIYNTKNESKTFKLEYVNLINTKMHLKNFNALVINLK